VWITENREFMIFVMIYVVPYVGPGCISESSYVRRCIYAFLLEVKI
jgi:hypothetical protein